MIVQELTDALCHALDLPEGQIVGFKDKTGLLVTPSMVCSCPEQLNNDHYEVMLKKR